MCLHLHQNDPEGQESQSLQSDYNHIKRTSPHHRVNFTGGPSITGENLLIVCVGGLILELYSLAVGEVGLVACGHAPALAG